MLLIKQRTYYTKYMIGSFGQKRMEIEAAHKELFSFLIQHPVPPCQNLMPTVSTNQLERFDGTLWCAVAEVEQGM